MINRLNGRHYVFRYSKLRIMWDHSFIRALAMGRHLGDPLRSIDGYRRYTINARTQTLQTMVDNVSPRVRERVGQWYHSLL